jgi:hypothetical protein
MAQVNAADLIGSYDVTGTEVTGKAYDTPGRLEIAMDKSGALDLKWDGGKYIGVAQLVGSTLAVATHDQGKVIIMLMDVKPDGSLAGRWWHHTQAGTKGTETWKKK